MVMSRRRLDMQPRTRSIGIKESEGTKELKTRIVLITEGEATEPDYFLVSIRDLVNEDKISIDFVGKHSGDYGKLVGFAKEAERKSSKGGMTEYWIVADTEDYRKYPEDFRSLTDWAEESDYHNLALSNTMFEVWVLMHGSGQTASFSKSAIHRSMQQLQSKNGKAGPLARYSDSNKHLNRVQFSKKEVKDAIQLAKSKRSTFGTGTAKLPPLQQGTTTVDLLVTKITGIC